MTPQELKNSILAMAFQGKLTQQFDADGSIDQLVKKCKEDKAIAIKEGKYRNEKFRGPIESDEYLIPENWCVMYISDISLFQEGPGILSVDFRTKGIPLIRIAGMQTSRVTLNGCNYLDPVMVETKWKHFRLDVGDILISTSASMDKVCEVYDDCAGAIPYTGQIRFKMYGGIYKEYFKWFVQSPFYIKQINAQQAGAAIKHYGPTHLKKMTIPIAPLAEQKRIVAKIEELLPYIDHYEQAWSKLEQFNSRFPEDMKKSLLQYAIQGKLVEQRPEEGTAEELFAQIQEEKQRLIAEKKIKKEKPLPEITEDEKPFDIPESWKWVRVGDIFAHNTGKAMNSTAKKVDKPGDVRRFITISNLYWNSFDFSSVKEMFFSDDELERCTVTKGDLLMCEGGAYYGRTAIWNYDYDICFQNHVHRLRPYKAVELLFFYHLFYFYKSMNMMNAKGTAMPGLSSQTLHQMVVPLPPLAEQKRIVEKLEQLLPLCEKLKERS